MKNRFASSRSKKAPWGLVGSIAAFAAMLVFLWMGMDSVDRASARERLRSTRQAVVQAAVHCYAVEGAYPSSLQYLEDHYGLYVDGERYLVDYRCYGSNIMPEITVLDRKAAQ